MLEIITVVIYLMKFHFPLQLEQEIVKDLHFLIEHGHIITGVLRLINTKINFVF